VLKVLSSLFVLTWRGAFSLPKHAWLIGIFGGFVFAKVAYFFVTLSGIKLLMVPVVCLIGAYYIVAGVGLWRAAERYAGPKLWTYSSKFLALFLALSFPIVLAANIV
jgi:hypothetical protein